MRRIELSNEAAAPQGPLRAFTVEANESREESGRKEWYRERKRKQKKQKLCRYRPHGSASHMALRVWLACLPPSSLWPPPVSSAILVAEAGRRTRMVPATLPSFLKCLLLLVLAFLNSGLLCRYLLVLDGPVNLADNIVDRIVPNTSLLSFRHALSFVCAVCPTGSYSYVCLTLTV